MTACDPWTLDGQAGIDRVVHHSVILDLMAVHSYRAYAASKKRSGNAAEHEV